MNDLTQLIDMLLKAYHIEILLLFVLLFSVSSIIFLIILFRRLPSAALTQLQDKITAMEDKQKSVEDAVKDEIGRNRQETAANAQQARQELSNSLKYSSDSLLKRMTENAGMQKDQLDTFSKQLMDMTKLHEEKFEAMRQTMESQLRYMWEDNSKKLEQMRATVDEKLQSTLEKRLGQSFKLVSERLEQVYKGLGEMRTLASGVGDLRKY